MGYQAWTARRRRLASLLVRETVTIGGVEFRVPYCGESSPFGSDYVEPLWVPGILPAAHRTFPGGFVDVGANIGAVLLCVKAHDPDWDYIGFEPNPICWMAAQQLANLNGIRNCRLIPAGLSDKPGLVELILNFPTDPSASILRNFRDPAIDGMKTYIHVSLQSGSEALATLGAVVGIIKVDVEGAELEVLRGLEAQMKSSRPLGIFEVLPIYDRNHKVGAYRLERQNELLKILRNLDYKVLRLEPPNICRLIADIGVHGDMALTDYLFVPGERLKELVAQLVMEGLSVPDVTMTSKGF